MAIFRNGVVCGPLVGSLGTGLVVASAKPALNPPATNFKHHEIQFLHATSWIRR
jgi:hypothetical protein